jgi:hypothetical protein
MSEIKKCTSKTIPCRAGVRCPEHKARNEALKEAFAKQDYVAYERIKKEAIESEQALALKIQADEEAAAEKLLETTDPFASNKASGIPASFYNFYHEETIRSLETISETILELPDANKFALGQAKHFNGRDGATLFEKNFLKPIIFGNKDGFIELVNKEGNFKLLNIIDMEADEDANTDTKNRTFADIALQISDKEGNVSLVPVNIKATLGDSSDNVCGWAAFQFMMAGKVKSKGASRANTLGKTTLESIAAATGASDYFLWSFNKGLKKPFDSAHAISLLQFKPSQFVFNASQSFPIQANVSKLVAARETLDSKLTLNDRRILWAKFLSDRYARYHSSEGAKAQAISDGLTKIQS